MSPGYVLDRWSQESFSSLSTTVVIEEYDIKFFNV